MGQSTVTGTVPVFTIPPSAVNVTLYQSGTTPVFVGTGTALTTASGMSVSTTPVTFRLFSGSAGHQLYATTGGASTAALCYVISG
jgi:hypothetical protein